MGTPGIMFSCTVSLAQKKQKIFSGGVGKEATAPSREREK